MTNLIQELYIRGIAHAPHWLGENTHYLTIMGSVAYGVSSDTSDMDIYGFAIPRKDELFPHLRGEIAGFGAAKNGSQRFRVYQEHHLKDSLALGGKGREYDLNVYNIVDYFQLCMENNPNMIDSLFTPDNCVLHSTRVGTIVRDHRRLFLHKRSYHSFKGYAYEQLKKSNIEKDEAIIEIRKFEDDHQLSHGIHFAHVQRRLQELQQSGSTARDLPGTGDQRDTLGLEKLSAADLRRYHDMFQQGLSRSKRFESRKIHNTDVKFLYHIARLADECEQILEGGDLDLQRSREYLKAIRRGDVSVDELKQWFSLKEKHLESLYHSSQLPFGPDEAGIKRLLFNCLEEHYGNLDQMIVQPDKLKEGLLQIEAIIHRLQKVIHS